MILRSEIQERWLGHEGEALLNGNIALIKYAPEIPQPLLTKWAHGVKAWLWTRKTFLPRKWPCQCLHIEHPRLQKSMIQWTGSKLGKEYVKAVYCHPAYLTYMQSTSCEMLGWMKHKLESRLPGEISISSDMQMKPSLWQKAKNQRASWWKWKRRVKKLA